MTGHRRTAWPRAEAAGRPRADLAWSRALAHPVRVEILRALIAHEPGTPSGFAAALEIPLGVSSHHVRRLRDLRLIRVARRTHHRGAVQHHYRLVDRAAAERALWRWGLLADEEEAAGATAAGATMRRVVAELRRRRERQGLTPAQLAARAGIGADSLARIERGEADPRISVLLALAVELGTSLHELLGAAEAEIERGAGAEPAPALPAAGR